MCGITGYVTASPGSRDDTVLRRMTVALNHRGPDDSGTFHDEHAHLGHTRLSIIDLASGHQPMTNEDGSLVIVYNGEIYNHESLRPGLERAGHRFATRCDTEAIVHACEEYGEDAVTHLRGMFAFATWNAATRTLFCARDRLGIKPLYYFWDGRLFAFASEIKALLEHPEIDPEVNRSALAGYLAYGYLTDDATLFRGIRKLLPGHSLTLRDGTLGIRRYWDVPEREADFDPSFEESVAECRLRLEEAVESHLMSDVPLGMFLSGGIDSSLIAALLQPRLSTPVETFSVGYAEEAYSELPFAKAVSGSLGTSHHEVRVSFDEFFAALPNLIWHEDEPICWPASVSLYFVSRLAAQHVKVVLTGEGSDEIFGGYHRYRLFRQNAALERPYAMIPRGLRERLRRFVRDSSLLGGTLRRRLSHTVIGRRPGFESLYLEDSFAAFDSDALEALLVGEAADSLGGIHDAARRHWDARSDASLLSRLLYVDQKTYLVELLMKQDQMSMATSLESRVPFLDHPLVEFAARLPDDHKLLGSTGKRVLKAVARGLLPASIVDRRKMGFPTPLRTWLRDDRARPLLDGLLDRDGLLPEVVDLDSIAALIAAHREGRVDGTDRIWRLLNLKLWAERFLGDGRATLTERVASRP